MKVGTDGVLLGAWADVTSAKSILDIGTGTGLIALMMAQRSDAFVTGIEIEKKATEEAAQNILNSSWSHRVRIINISLQDFERMNPGSYDLIVSNPPFFENSQKSKCEMLAMAKHNHLLPLSDLIGCSARLLNPMGKLAFILPPESINTLKNLAKNENLYLIRETEVKPNNLKKPHRYLIEFCKTNSRNVEKDIIRIHNDDGLDYTCQYKELTRPFYLNF